MIRITKINKKCFNLTNPPSSFCFLSPTPSPLPYLQSHPTSFPTSVLTVELWGVCLSSPLTASQHWCAQVQHWLVYFLPSFPLPLTRPHRVSRSRLIKRRREQDRTQRFVAERGWTSFICIYTTSSSAEKEGGVEDEELGKGGRSRFRNVFYEAFHIDTSYSRVSWWWRKKKIRGAVLVLCVCCSVWLQRYTGFFFYMYLTLTPPVS